MMPFWTGFYQIFLVTASLMVTAFLFFWSSPSFPWRVSKDSPWIEVLSLSVKPHASPPDLWEEKLVLDDAPTHGDSYRRRLMATGAVASASVREQRPHTLEVDIELKRPLWQSGDFANTGVSDRGEYMPLYPYWTPQRLVRVRVGTLAPVLPRENPWSKQLSPALFHSAQLLIASLEELGKKYRATLEWVDLSRFLPSSHSIGELVVSYGWEGRSVTLWMSTKETSAQIHALELLWRTGNLSRIEEGVFVDLRSKGMALIERVRGENS